MKLTRLRLKNFRCYKDETTVDINDLTVLVGRNDSGKSAIFDALAIFFGEASLDADDASISGDRANVSIVCEFENLPDDLIIDRDYPTSLDEEYLLNEHGRLEIHKLFNGSLKNPQLKETYARAIHPTADKLNDLLSLKNSELKQRATELNISLESIDTRINTQIRRKLWDSTTELNTAPQVIPLEAEAAKKIWDQLSKYLPTFALFKSDRASTDQDAEAQNPMKAAVKEAIKSKETELAEIASYVEQEVKTIAERTVSKLQEMDPSLASQLEPHFSPPNWANVFKISLTGDEDIPINKRGSGIRRLILINFFRAKAEQAAREKGSPSIIYAVEEPETSQHPINQKMLMNAFYQLSDLPECQVLLSTHTPVLARFIPLEDLRFISVATDESRRIHRGDEETYRQIAKSLGVLPDHSVKLFIGVEGINDKNFLCHISKALIENGVDVPDLDILEENGEIIFFPLGGSNLVLWSSRLSNLNRPEIYIFDREEEPPTESRNQKTVNEINSRSGCKAFLTGKKEIENYLHPDAIRSARHEVNITFGDYDDVPELAAKAIHETSESENEWDELGDERKKDKMRRAKSWLNTNAVAAMTPDLLTNRDPDGDIRGWLAEIKAIIEQD